MNDATDAKGGHEMTTRESGQPTNGHVCGFGNYEVTGPHTEQQSIDPSVPIPIREICQRCGCVSRVGFKVPDAVWLAVVGEFNRWGIWCLNCFTTIADEKMIPWDSNIKLFPVSFHTHNAMRDDWLAARSGGEAHGA